MWAIPAFMEEPKCPSHIGKQLNSRACLDHLAKRLMIVTSATGDRDHQRCLVTNRCTYAAVTRDHTHTARHLRVT